jgi:hypothetical protein
MWTRDGQGGVTVAAALERVEAARERWIEVERLADDIGDECLAGWTEQVLLAMLRVRDRLEQLEHADRLEAAWHGTVAELEREVYGDPDEAAA